jgi:peroxiredoxin
MKNRTSKLVMRITIISLLTALLFLFYSLITYSYFNKKTLPGLPCVKINQPINYFDLKNPQGFTIDKSALFKKEFAAIFIFKKSCSSCDPNLGFWKKIYKTFRNHNINYYGVILSDLKIAIDVFAQKNLNFKLYSPIDLSRFEEEFNVEFNLSQTILLRRNKVIYSKAGDIGANDYFQIKKRLKGEHE